LLCSAYSFPFAYHYWEVEYQLKMKIHLLLVLAFVLGGMPKPCICAAAPTAADPDMADPEYRAYREQSDKERAELIAKMEAQQKAITPEMREQMRDRFERLPRPEDAYDWKEQAAEHDLDQTSQAQLARDGFIIGRRQFLQEFVPYDNPRGPVFITSDSLLCVYHVLFEETFRDLEILRIAKLRSYLEKCLCSARVEMAKLPFPQAELAASWMQVQRVVGPALILLGAGPELLDPAVRGDVEESVSLIRKAEGSSIPRWLVPATPDFLGIDYTRMRPVSFYDQGPRLQDYYRAVRWLQSVPFRTDVDVEYGAITLLRLGRESTQSYPDIGYLSSLSSIVGEPDGPGLDEAPALRERDKFIAFEPSWEAQLSVLRGRKTPSPARVREGLHASVKPSAPVFHLINASALPETVLFQSLIDEGKRITGLQVAATIGSGEAVRLLSDDARSPLLFSEIEKRRESKQEGSNFYPPSGLYEAYTWTLAALFTKPDPAAPAFMGEPAWEAKSIQTALSSWVQMRHSFALQTKVSMSTLGAHMMPPGFIEPNPVFLRRFSELVQSTRRVFKDSGAFSRSELNVICDLQDQASLCDKVLELGRYAKMWKLRLTPEWEQLGQESEQLFRIFDVDEMTEEDSYNWREALGVFWEGKELQRLQQYSLWLRRVADDLASGKRHMHASSGGRNEFALVQTRWDNFERLALRLETLLQKQLRQADWNDEEEHFIKNYGSHMANFMGYSGNSHFPRDDAPRWVQLAGFPERGTLFAAATGRPRALYVLYPWKGMLIFCEGAVVPYYEYEGKGILTDSEWALRLIGPDAPSAPSWIQPVMQEGNAITPKP
jgi:hypothetical protein